MFKNYFITLCRNINKQSSFIDAAGRLTTIKVHARRVFILSIVLAGILSGAFWLWSTAGSPGAVQPSATLRTHDGKMYVNLVTSLVNFHRKLKKPFAGIPYHLAP
jgi:hypothetical protein